MITPEQLIEQTTRHSVYLERLKTGNANEVLDLLRQIEDRLLGRLSRSDVTEWSRARLERQVAAIRASLNQQYADLVLAKLDEQIRELAAYETEFEKRSLEQVVQYQFTLPDPEQVIAAVQAAPLSISGPDGGKLLESFIEDWTQDQIGRATNSIRAGYAQGETTAAIVRRLRDEVIPTNRRTMSTVVRTALAHVQANAREEVWKSNRDIIKRVRWTSTLDKRTSSQCQLLDGQVFKIGEGPRPPAHPNCRSTTVAVLDERFSFLQEDAERFARDPETGQVNYVDADQTYYGWLKRQPAEVQDSIIGPTRGKLLRDGGLSAQRFAELQLGKQFKPLTLKEMRGLEPLALAFKRAGLERQS